MVAVASSSKMIFVVDPATSDYAALARSIEGRKWKIRFFSSGREALRLDERSARGVWIVNVRLPDMSGFDLIEMLKPRLGKAATVMVADLYRTEDEIRALSLGVTLYLCKPLSAACLPQRHSVGE